MTGCGSDFTPLNVTLVSLLYRKSSSHYIFLPLIPREINAFKMAMWLTLSKALSKSRKSVSTVDLPFVKPKRYFGLGSVNITLTRISLSMIFSVAWRRDVGL